MGTGVFDLEKYSPEGEDFILNVCVEDENNADYWKEVFDYWNNFDADDHAAMWYGQNRGEPTSLRVLLDDAEAIAKMLERLWRALLNASEEQEATR